jgi:hypothetical protein
LQFNSTSETYAIMDRSIPPAAVSERLAIDPLRAKRMLATRASPARETAVQPPKYASLIFDHLGIVRFCNRGLARLIDCDGSEITGRPVRSLLLDLPFSDKTPGYNVSLAKVMFGPGEWHPVRLARSDGGIELVDAALESLELDGRRLFVLELRYPSMQPEGGD